MDAPTRRSPFAALRAMSRRIGLRRVGCVVSGIGLAIAGFSAPAGAKVAHHKVHKTHRIHVKRVHNAVAKRPAGIKGHVATWATDDGCAGGAGASPALVRGWLSYAESNCGTSSKARTDCHARGRRYCQVMQYLDTDWDFFGDAPHMASAASNDWWLHAPRQGSSISTSTEGGGFLINQTRAAVRSFFRSFVRQHYNADDGLLMDWQSPALSEELYYSTCGCTSTQEIHTNRQLQKAHTEMSAALTHSNGTRFAQVDNSISPNPYLPQGLNMLNRGAGVYGLMAESDPESNGVMDTYYSTLLDQLAYIDARTRAYIVLLSHGAAGAPYQSASRRVQEATILLGFHGAQVVDGADLEDGSQNLAVWPEESIYPADPVQTMQAPRGRGCLGGLGGACTRGGHNNLQVAPGIFRRVFRACYRGRVAIGPCAAIVNSTGNWVTVRSSWLRHRFGHQVTFLGGDVQSGGKLDLTGAPFSAGSTLIAPHDALLLTS